MDFAQELIKWYKKNGRELPWRMHKDAYKIWLSEVILQQTRVNQGLAYYHRFTERWPRLQDLAAASEDEVLKLWQGLGYYSRARNLLFTARYLTQQNKASFPQHFTELKKLKGIGDYTAAAIASICFNEAVAVVDGNVIRVLSRLYGIKEPFDTGAGKKVFWKTANDLIPSDNPAEYNQAIMDFGALQCKPKSPECHSCPFTQECFARQHNLIDQLPVKSKKTKVKNRYLNFLILHHAGQYYIERRDNSGIWAGLYQFPILEKSRRTSAESLIEELSTKGLLKKEDRIAFISKTIIHQLSHQKLHCKFIHIDLTHDFENSYLKVNKADLENYAFPQLIVKYLQNQKL